MKKVSFLFGIHNHQPIGNLDEVIEEAYRKSYEPFVNVLLNHPKIKWSLHCTGILWEWIEKHHPDYFDRVKVMVERRQVELLSGGFYEPILPILPDADKVGQIKKLNQYLKDHFNVEPKGMWCAERVWEPHLPKPIHEAHIQYTVLDDAHFLSAGLPMERLNGYYRVEEQSDSIDIFPISQELRYATPFMVPKKSIEILEKAAHEYNGGRMSALVMADDGEKFGLWPNTFKLVYEEKWLEEFLTLLEGNAPWLETETFSEYRKKNKPAGRISLPTASYFEMSEWSLPTQSGIEFEDILQDLSRQEKMARVKKFMKGGIWRNFLVKYPEANSMYKKMLRVSRKVHNAIDHLSSSMRRKEDLPDHSAEEVRGMLNSALNFLWAGQCNCAYWHGVFGGLYLPMLRQAIYKNLIDAEKALDSLNLKIPHRRRKKQLLRGIELCDFDGDGNDELLIETPLQNVYISPACGGAIFEWDFKPASVNVGNVLGRQPEAYHRKLKAAGSGQAGPSSGQTTASIHDIVTMKEKGLENLLSYDWYRRMNMIDHFMHPGTSQESFKSSMYGEQGDFVLEPYEYKILKDDSLDADESKNKNYAVKLSRNGSLWVDDKRKPLRVEKIVRLHACSAAEGKPEGSGTGLQISYRITNCSDEPVDNIWFASEFSFAFSVPEKDQDVSFKGLKRWERMDRYLYWKLRVEFSDNSDAWIFPLETVSNSEGGFEKTFQGIVFLPHWKFSLQGKQSFEKVLSFTIEKT